MTVRLYHFLPSFCSQKVRLALSEKGVPYEQQVVDIGPGMENYEPWYVRLNPAAVVPTLVHDERVVTDSKRILHYVDEAFDGPSLTPQDEGERARMNVLIDRIDALPIRALSYGAAPRLRWILHAVVELRRRRLKKHRRLNPDLAEVYEAKIADVTDWQAGIVTPEVTAAARAQAAEVLDFAEAELADGRAYWVGGYSMGDLMLTTLVARLVLLGLRGELEARPALAHWYVGMRARPSFAEANIMERKEPKVMLPIFARLVLPRLAVLSLILGVVGWLVLRFAG